MTLVDTSVWVDYFRGADRAAQLATLLEDDEVSLHPWVLGELALGNLGTQRHAVIDDLRRLPAATRIADREVFQLVEARHLAGRGSGWVDAHLLAAALVTGSGLWTFDRKLAQTASELGIASS